MNNKPEERCFKNDRGGNNLRDRMFKNSSNKMKKNTHGMSEHDCQRTNASGHFGRVGNTQEHPMYGVSKWSCNVWITEFYDNE
jgi:hypothetical protein